MKTEEPCTKKTTDEEKVAINQTEQRYIGRCIMLIIKLHYHIVFFGGGGGGGGGGAPRGDVFHPSN